MREALPTEEPNNVISSTKKKKLEEDTVSDKQQKLREEEGQQEKGEEDIVFALVPMVRTRSQAAKRRVTPTCAATLESVEKKLSNGDLYIGSFSGGVPHGLGKYLWKDGCMYEGEWKRGKASGKGKFAWPSGATFVGDFKFGRMEGMGTFIGVEGDTYPGAWVADRKHGYGQKRYANGDFYEGTWRRNLQDGKGRYVWRNGNQYVGEWKSGVIYGKGVLIWANGDEYEGQWENGIPKGSGVFISADGSSFAGNWNEEDGNVMKIQLQRLSDTGGGKENLLKGIDKKDLIVTTRKRSSVDGGRGSLGAEKAFPRICIWDSDGEAGDITCDIIDNVEASMVYREGILVDRDGFRRFGENPCCFSGEAKKPGQTISKGHKDYGLMLNLQIGIR